MSSQFCSCQDLNCKNHPRNHSQGCDPCIKKNLSHEKIPACFFRAVSPEISDLKEFTYESFSKFVLEYKK